MKYLSWILLVVCPLSALAQTSPGLDKLVDDWLNLEIQKGHLQSTWNLRRADLEQRLSLLDTEHNSLTELLAKRSEISSDVDQRRLTLLETQDRLEKEQQSLDAQLQETLQLAQALHTRLPPPLRAEWQEKFPLLQEDGVKTSEKLERLLGLFKLAEDFNDRVALHSGTLDIPDGTGVRKILVSQIYLGITQGWYISQDGKTYGYGRATPLGWQWWHGPEADIELGHRLDPALLLKARAILENPTTAEFIALPVKL